MKALFQYPSARESSSDSNVRLTRLATAMVLTIGLGATMTGLRWLQQNLEAKARTRFDQQVERIEADVRHDLNRPFSGLKGAAGVYAASVSVERAEFRAYVESSKIAHEYPGIGGFGFVERVKKGDVDGFVAAQRRDGSPDFAVKTQGNEADLYVVKFIEPAEPNQAALGLNLASDPVRKQAIERAITTGEATLSGRIYLVQDARQRTAFMFLLPIYRHGSHPETVQQRQAAQTGVLMAPVVVDEIMSGVAASAQGQISFALYDGPEGGGATPGNLLFDLKESLTLSESAAPRSASATPMFQASRVILVGGRPLTLRMGTTPVFEAQQARSTPMLLAVTGILLSSLLAFSVWLLGSGRARALALAHRMTADLAHERQRLLNIVEGTNVGTWVWHVQTGELQLDERWAAMMGHDLQVLGPLNISTWRKRIHPDDRLAAAAALKRHFSGESRFFECEHRIRHSDGRWIWILERGKVSTWTSEGKPDLMSGTHMDISDKQATQLALRTSEENFRHLFESSLHGILQAQPDGAVLYANPAARRLFGLTQDEIRQRGHAGLADPEDSRFHIFMAQALMAGEARGEMTMVRGDGSRFECELSLSNYLSQSGASCTNIFLRDVTKRKLAEAQIRDLNTELEDRVKRRTAQLEAANKELEAFSYSVAHDLRSPLNAIDGFSHLLEKAVSGGAADSAAHYLRRIRAGVKQMGELTDGLLSLAHVSRTSLKTDTVDLTAMAARVLENWQERDTGRAVIVHIQPDLIAQGDPTLLRQVMENLLGNAWKFTANAVAPEIWVGKLPGSQAITTYFVQDNGAGFDMAYVDKLFGTFQRLHSPGEFAGTGIGLATSQRIISRHAGRIWAEGTVGQGATFFFTIPSGPRAAAG
ncbi:MAG: CHASE domain-containing protein [Polaromonas sp.]|uniref:CHASE domain-containing protein n=1 Tax=Polaromonas sp. TaxID=1869339 RepID=UPI0027320DC0|nr:CHASE domain-containing protein [Polaromonas sp.]MDP2256011.1 CHASE domain-containing protein [Polaromonas sp.]